MRKNKKLLLGGLSVLTLVAAGSGAVSTFAWYTMSTNAVKQTVDNEVVEALTNPYAAASDVVFVLEFGGSDYVAGAPGHYNKKVLSNRFGETFYYAGNNKKQDTTTAISAKVGTGTLTVSTTASTEQLQILANGSDVVYKVKIQASGQAKVDKTTTSAAGTDADHDETYDDGDDTYAEGVLGNAPGNLALIGYIKVTQAGVLQYSTDGSSYTNWGGSSHAYAFYYGVAPAATTAESNETIAAYTLGLAGKLTTNGDADLPAAE